MTDRESWPEAPNLSRSEPARARAGAGLMTDDEIAAFHESAHAVFAVFGNWTKLAGPVALNGHGHGDVVMSTDAEAIRRSFHADPGFDRDLPRIELVRSLLAGPIAERILAESGRAELSERDLQSASEGDYAVVAEQLEQLKPLRPGLLPRLEREVRDRLEQPAVRPRSCSSPPSCSSAEGWKRTRRRRCSRRSGRERPPTHFARRGEAGTGGGRPSSSSCTISPFSPHRGCTCV